jgi:hypothetical protein
MPQCAKSFSQPYEGLRVYSTLIWSQDPLMGSMTYVLSSIELFGVTQQEGKSIHAYLKMFNTEKLNVKELFKSKALKALIREVIEYAL